MLGIEIQVHFRARGALDRFGLSPNASLTTSANAWKLAISNACSNVSWHSPPSSQSRFVSDGATFQSSNIYPSSQGQMCIVMSVSMSGDFVPDNPWNPVCVSVKNYTMFSEVVQA